MSPDCAQLYLVEEKPISAKLEILFRQSRFFLAIKVARAAGVDESGIADIHRQYGDHLYSTGADDGAMQQYVKTIGYLQPSYVIRKVCFSMVFITETVVLTWEKFTVP